MPIDRSQAPQSGALNITTFPDAIHYTLGNGMPVYLIPFGREDLVEIQMLYAAGHSYEPQPGICSVTARMLQEGNRSYDSLGFAEILDFYGASLDIESGNENTTFSLVTLTKHLDKTLELFQEMLYHPTFPEKEFQLHIQRMLQQIQLEEQKTSYVARRYFGRHLFGKGHPYGQHTGKEELSAIEYNSLAKYYNEYLKPGPQAILCTGRFDIEYMKDVLNNSLGRLAYHPHTHRSSAEERLFTTEPGYFTYPVKESLQSTIRAGLPTISKGHADYYKLQMVSIILGGYFGSRLMKNIREDKGYTYGIHCSLMGLKYAGYCTISTDVAHANIEDTIREIKKEIKILQEGLMPYSELEIARNYLYGALLSRRETLFQIGGIIKNALIVGQDIHDMNRVFREVEEITPEEIQTYARKYLNLDSIVWVIAGNTPETN